MIPCPVCLMVLDGHGGICRTHESWRACRVWLPALWPTLEDLVDQVEASGPARTRAERLAEAMAASRHQLHDLCAGEIYKVAALTNFGGRGVHIGLRHFREGYDAGRPRSSYARAAEAILLPLLVASGVLEHDQVDGLSHLFYVLTPGELPGPAAPSSPGVQLVIYDRGT